MLVHCFSLTCLVLFFFIPIMVIQADDMTDDFLSAIFYFSEYHILLEIDMLLEFIPIRLFFCHLDHRVLILRNSQY